MSDDGVAGPSSSPPVPPSPRVETAGVEAGVDAQPAGEQDAELLPPTEDDAALPREVPEHNLIAAQQALQGGIFTMATDHPPLRLSSIRLIGTTHVRPSFLSHLCAPYISQPTALQRLLGVGPSSSSSSHPLPAPGERTTLRELLALSARLAEQLDRLDLFRGVDVTLLPSASADSPHSKEETDIVIQLAEAPRFWLKSSSDVGNGEGSVSLQGRVRNLFGGGEKLEGSYEVGTRTRSALNATLSAPVAGSADHVARLGVYSCERDKSWYASHEESSAGLRVSIEGANRARGLTNELACEGVWRRIGRVGAGASTPVRRERGDDVKTSLVHTLVHDTRDEPFLGSEGWFGKSVTELASRWLGGGRDHLRWEGEASLTRRLDFTSTGLRGEVQGWGYSTGLRTGFILPLRRGERHHLSDLFHLGGPTSLRMFSPNSLGPKSGRDSLGGWAYYEVGGSLFAPCWPGKAHWPLKVHAFLNAGQVAGGASSRGQSLLSAAREPSMSAGMGLAYTQGPLRVEVNAGMPITSRRGDGQRKGVQFGIGIDFLGG
ncbi:hypothetical protein BDZ90DRAFT_281493 [Jaminaea rosea]|uniref:Bacterial surface antigen (D15) domain-containing protein n=1 Tax=Jaminaea rosea TaxID=1569628 RepID=A0A316UKD1_9BASI|nr:hypothetical protein BDZ90DRAFT_281493 [Jaminaea rosea]PWN25680.1 hypothetical protein BDZ90DRAFT_281493 [Jaminaea rosea]